MTTRKITILTAAKALTKTFRTGAAPEPYPMIRDFTSTVVGYSSLDEFYTVVTTAASLGACLLKGNLSRAIVEEPRAGLGITNEETDWIVLDYDSDGGFDSIDELLAELDPALTETSYVFQHSASSGITGKAGIRGHVFFMLTDPVAPTILKQWITKANLLSKKLRPRIKLSRNAMALCYALDTTVNQNDKLIYVAPPTLIDIEDPIHNRFELHRRERDTYTFTATVSAEFNKTKAADLLEELRDAIGLQKQKPRYDSVGGEEILLNPGTCVVTGVKTGTPYTRVNLNGGDSWAYWYFTDNPEILYNYKGEPAVYLKDVAPDYYAQIQIRKQEADCQPIVFRERAQDQYYNLMYNPTEDRVLFCTPAASKDRLVDFMRSKGAPPVKVIPDWDFVFDPTQLSPLDFVNRKLNLYVPSDYLRARTPQTQVTEADFPVISRVLHHICVEEEVYQKFVRWIAHIVQFGTRTQTAWLFSGTEGTGKGITFTDILAPILGEKQCMKIQQKEVESEFNGFMENRQLVFLDEGDISSHRAADRIMSHLRTVITDAEIPIRRMRTNPYSVENFCNIIVASNRTAAIRLQQQDRRWNIAPRQNLKLNPTREELQVLEARSEIQAFTHYLKQLKISKYDSTELVETQAREDLLEISRTVADDFFSAIAGGDLDYFAEQLQDKVPLPENGYIAFSETVQKWMADAVAGKDSDILLEDLVKVYNYLGGKDKGAKQMGQLLARYGLTSTRVRMNGIQRRVLRCTFEDRGYELWFARNKKSQVRGLVDLPEPPQEVATAGH